MLGIHGRIDTTHWSRCLVEVTVSATHRIAKVHLKFTVCHLFANHTHIIQNHGSHIFSKKKYSPF